MKSASTAWGGIFTCLFNLRLTFILFNKELIYSIRNLSRGISRYITQKNWYNTPNRLELKKFCPYCYKHTIHGEIKK